MERRHFIQGLIAAVAGKELIVQATDTEIAAFSVGDQALLHPVNLTRFEKEWLREAEKPAQQAWCQLSFADGTRFTFAVADIRTSPVERNIHEYRLNGETEPHYIQGLRRPQPITLIPTGPIRID